MAHWNYRVIADISRRTIEGAVIEEPFCNIHSVHYSDSGVIELWSIDPVPPMGETLTELKKDLARMNEACDKPVLNMADLNDPKKRETLK